MRLRLIAVSLLLALFSVQTATAVAQVAAAPTPRAAPISTPQVTVPPGTVIPLVLASQIRSRSTKVGDTVRAQVSFPVTAGMQVAVPAGTYVEGTITAISGGKLRRWQTNPAGLEVHFTKLIFANGYTVPLDAQIHAENLRPLGRADGAELAQLEPEMPVLQPSALEQAVPEVSDASPFVPAFGRSPLAGFSGAAGQTTSAPQSPPLPGPPKSFVAIGIVIAVAAVAGIVATIFAIHRASNYDWVVFDSGYPFSMALTGPLTVDPAQAAAVLGGSPQ